MSFFKFFYTTLFSLFLLSTFIISQEFSQEVVFKEGKIKIIKSGNLPEKPKTALVLSGGGSRGIAHIGVLQVLDSVGIEPDLIVGTSIGSVIGGLYAAGYSIKQILQIAHSINWQDIFSDEPQRASLFLGQKGEEDRYLLSLRLKDFKPYIPNALTPGQKVLNLLSDLFLMAPYQVKNSFDDLKIPLRSVATDIVSGNMVVLKDGNLAEAINGSLAVPLLFSPVKRNGMLLVDGGIKDNLPVSVAMDMNMDLIIASDVSATLRDISQINAPWEVADQVTTIMTDRSNLKEHKNVDVLVLPKIPKVTNTDFTKIDSMIDAGKTAALQMINAYEIVLSNWRLQNQSKKIEVDRVVFDKDEEIKLKTTSVFSAQKLLEDLSIWLDGGEYKKITVFYDSTLKSIEFNFTPFSIIDSIQIIGNQNLSKTEFLDSLFLKTGNQLNVRILKEDLLRLVKIYRSKGFSLMEVSKLGFNEDSGLLLIGIDEGGIEDIVVEGNTKSEDYIILREFTALEQDVFNWLSVKNGIDNVFASSLYNRVTASIERKGQQANLIVSVDERPSVRFKMGGKANIERRFQAYLELADDNLLGQGMKANMQTKLGVRDGLLGLNFRDDRILTSFVTFNAGTYFSWEVNPINMNTVTEGRYREERLGLVVQLGQQLERIGQLIGEFKYEQIKDFVDDGDSLNISQDLQIQTFALRSITDKRNKSDFPTKGIYNHWLFELGKILTNGESFTKILINLEGFYPTFPEQVLHFRFFGGLGSGTLPFSENFRTGGLDNFYGLQKNELYGRQIVVSNLEYRYKLPFQILTDTYISVRYDFGGVWKNPDLIIKTKDFFTGIGGYLGFDTFLGPLYIGWGKTSLGRKEIYLSLGFNF